MTLSAQRLQQVLPGRPVRYLAEVESTNDNALQWLGEGAAAGAVVIADTQSRGRGRGDHQWYTPPGTALAISLILKPQPEQLLRLTMLGALAIAECCEALGVADVWLKWPNDVLLGGRKVSGVLTEAAWLGDQLLGAVLGMGLNVRVDFKDTSVAGRAISLETAAGRHLDRAELVAQLLQRVDAWYPQLGTAIFFDTWKSRLSTLGAQVQIGSVTGIAVDVDEHGALLVRDAAGQVHQIFAGDLRTQL